MFISKSCKIWIIFYAEPEDDQETAVFEQEQEVRSARNVASEPQVSEEDDGDENNEFEDGDKDEEDANEEDEEQDDGEQLKENEDDESEKDNDEEEESENEDQDQPESAEEQSEGNEDEQGENVSAEDEFLFREIPGVTASTEVTEDSDDDIAQGNIDQGN